MFMQSEVWRKQNRQALFYIMDTPDRGIVPAKLHPRA